jgi:hypothetical protein
MLKKTLKDQSGKLAAVTAVLDQLSLDTLKLGDAETLRKFRESVERWAALAASDIARRCEDQSVMCGLLDAGLVFSIPASPLRM